MRLVIEVACEIVQAHAQVQSRHCQIRISEQAIEGRSRRSIEINVVFAILRVCPSKLYNSIQALEQARRECLRALMDYNTPQFRLQRALGWPINKPAVSAMGDPVEGLLTSH